MSKSMKTIQYGNDVDQECEILKYLDDFGNIVHKGKDRKFQVFLENPPTVTGFLGGTSIASNDRQRIFEMNSIPNILSVRKICGLSIGVPNRRKIFESHENMSSALRKIPSTSYLFHNLTKGLTTSQLPFLQFHFLTDEPHYSMFPRRHLGVHPKSKLRILYYEVRVYRGIYGIGLAPEGYSTVGIGWNKPSIGYHADNGMIYGVKGHSSRGYQFYDCFEKEKLNSDLSSFGYCHGNVIGVGIDFNEQKIFFTKNGIEHPHAASLKNEYPRKIFMSDLTKDEEEEKEGKEEKDEESKKLRNYSEMYSSVERRIFGKEMFPSIGGFPSLSQHKAISFDVNLGEDTIKNPFMFEKLNHKEDLLYIQDKKERFDFVVEHYTDFEIIGCECVINVFKSLLLY